MKMRHVLIKRALTMAALIVLSAIIVVACSSGGGDDGNGGNGGNGGGGGGGGIVQPPPTTPVQFSAPEEAAQVTSAALTAKAVSEAQFIVAMDLGVLSVPLSGPSGAYAPGVSKTAGATYGALDPALKTALEAMIRQSRSPLIRKVLGKIGSSNAKRANIIGPNGPEVVTDWCANAEGQVKITGTNNYDDIASTTLTSVYDVEFVNCKDDVMVTQLDGKLHIERTESVDGAQVLSTLTATGLTELLFSDIDFAVMIQKSVMNGSFSADNQDTSGTNTADGTFVLTTPAVGAVPEKVITYTYDNESDVWTLTRNADGSESKTDTITGSFEIKSASGGVETGRFSLGLNLAETTDTLNDAAGTRNNSLSGTVDMGWTPDLTANGCRAGRITIATTAPRSYTAASGTCPVSGALTINNATLTYGSPIFVTVDAETQAYADCAALDLAGGVCSF